MSQLHELLAVEGDLQGSFKKIIEESKHVFKDNRHIFFGVHKKLELFEESEMETPTEHQELVSTVGERLKYTLDYCGRYFDAVLQKEHSNQSAKADLIIDEQVIAKDLPATFLLGMESKLKLVREVIQQIPTLQSGVSWIPNNEERSGTFKTEFPEKKYKTAKSYKTLSVAKSTKDHPEQVKVWEDTKNVGMYSTETTCGMIPSSEKASLLERTDTLIQAVKKARQRANTVEVADIKVAEKLFKYIMG